MRLQHTVLKFSFYKNDMIYMYSNERKTHAMQMNQNTEKTEMK